MIIVCCVLIAPKTVLAADKGDVTQQIALVNTETNAAIDRVVEIVNQPVTHLTRDPAANITMFSPGWFHDGAIKPDFNTVDIRQTQTFPYLSHFVSSNLNPTEMFRGGELEFNLMTKYFYMDRTLPKKKLSEAEMLEINRLYRIIGSGEAELARLKKSQSGQLPALFTKIFKH